MTTYSAHCAICETILANDAEARCPTHPKAATFMRMAAVDQPTTPMPMSAEKPLSDDDECVDTDDLLILVGRLRARNRKLVALTRKALPLLMSGLEGDMLYSELSSEIEEEP